MNKILTVVCVIALIATSLFPQQSSFPKLTGPYLGQGGNDFYICFNKGDGTWTKAANMGKEIYSNAGEIQPFATRDGKYFFFCSTRRISYPRYTDPAITYKKNWNG